MAGFFVCERKGKGLYFARSLGMQCIRPCCRILAWMTKAAPRIMEKGVGIAGAYDSTLSGRALLFPIGTKGNLYLGLNYVIFLHKLLGLPWGTYFPKCFMAQFSSETQCRGRKGFKKNWFYTPLFTIQRGVRVVYNSLPHNSFLVRQDGLRQHCESCD